MTFAVTSLALWDTLSAETRYIGVDMMSIWKLLFSCVIVDVFKTHESKPLIYCSPWDMSIVSKLDALKTSRVESSTSDNPIQVLQ